ncbi:MAG: substrate-binding domain-containing protein, partial [Novosphingobium sp.]|nr:substrate-binding domain-containing protein [Novosphingobium sp.]
IAPDAAHERAPGIGIDDTRAAGAMARHLWDLGHRHFAIVSGPETHLAAQRRGDGFVRTLRELGLEIDLVETEGGFSFDGGIAAGEAILARNPRPTAIFAGNDDSAAGVMAACSRAGLKVPDDISVCGFDDSWIARSVWPYLTTVHQPVEDMGRAAALLLLRRDEPEQGLRLLDHHLVIRDSTAAPPAR